MSKKPGMPEEWTLVSDQLLDTKPELEGIAPQDIFTFREYLDRIHPLRTDIADEAQRNAANRDTELQRNTKLLNFTKPGNPGTKFKGPFEKMMKAITIPKTVKEDLGISDETAGEVFILSNKPVVDTVPEEENEKPQKGHEDDDEGHSKKATEEEKAAQEAKLVKQLLGEGKYHLLPSFFRTLIYLKKMKKEFAVVFRNYNA